MLTLQLAILAYLRSFLIARHALAMEAAALRKQVAVYKRKQPRPKLHRFDRLFWVVGWRIWSNWPEALILVKPDTVVSWHRAGYRLFWRWRSRSSGTGRPKIDQEIRQLIRRMKHENPTWGAPRIHGELLLLGFEISEPTVFPLSATTQAHSAGELTLASTRPRRRVEAWNNARSKELILHLHLASVVFITATAGQKQRDWGPR